MAFPQVFRPMVIIVLEKLFISSKNESFLVSSATKEMDNPEDTAEKVGISALIVQVNRLCSNVLCVKSCQPKNPWLPTQSPMEVHASVKLFQLCSSTTTFMIDIHVY